MPDQSVFRGPRPHARFKLTEDDVLTAARHHRQLAARENPIHSLFGYWICCVLLGAVMFWITGKAFESVFGPEKYAWFGRWPAIALIAAMQTRARTTSFSEIAAFRGNPMAHAELGIAWSEAGIEINPTAPSPLAWRTLEKWSEVDGMMLIYVRARIYAFLPRRALNDEERDLMRSYLEAAQVPRAGKPWWRL